MAVDVASARTIEEALFGGGFAKGGAEIDKLGNYQSKGSHQSSSLNIVTAAGSNPLAAVANGVSGYAFTRSPLATYPFQSDLHNHFWAADRRFTVTLSGFVNPSTFYLFNGEYEYANFNTLPANTTGVISIDLTAKSEYTANGLTYPTGHIYLYFYGGTGLDSNLTISGRVKNKDNTWYAMTGGIWLGTNAPGEPTIGKIYRITVPSISYGTVLEITVASGALPVQYPLLEVDYHLLRPSISSFGYLDKAKTQNIHATTNWRNSSNVITASVNPDTGAIGGTTLAISGDTTLSGDITLGAGSDFTLNTTTGTKIGGATNQKLGFWGATAVAQPAAVANATDATSVIARLNDLLARLRTTGLIAT